MENKLEDFTEGSEWMIGEMKLKFSHFDPEDGLPLFIPLKEHRFIKEDDGTVGFHTAWKSFTKVESKC